MVKQFPFAKSIPTSKGMSQPQLFQYVEPSISGIVTMVTFQKSDSELVYQRQSTLGSEIHQILSDDEDERIFVNNEEGIWSGGVHKTKTGNFLAGQQSDHSSLEYTKKNAQFMHFPPKKHIHKGNSNQILTHTPNIIRVVPTPLLLQIPPLEILPLFLTII
jgi:hypothetical protein